MPTILIVDGEQDIRDLISLNLHREGFETLEAADGLEALKIARKTGPDLVILDLMLPQMDGIKVYREMREDSRTNQIPVLMLTARGKLEEKINGLELGADDYVTKPFSPKELMLRVRNLLRRTLSSGGSDVVEIGDCRLDKNNLKLHLEGDAIDVTATEFKLLLVLTETPGITKERGEHGHHIETVRGVGYRFDPAEKTPTS